MTGDYIKTKTAGLEYYKTGKERSFSESDSPGYDKKKNKMNAKKCQSRNN